ncbi:uncharacterized protein [Bemisia tabaci]|uniref:uncharacterized protein n=1 Tax=Bemisia tabaci TaxID=7038 RepID=UPI003B288ED8
MSFKSVAVFFVLAIAVAAAYVLPIVPTSVVSHEGIVQAHSPWAWSSSSRIQSHNPILPILHPIYY